MNSALNPEAPEFFPHLTSVTQDGYRFMHKSVRSSNTLPSGMTHEFFKTFTNFNIVTCQLSENVVHQSNYIIATEIPHVKLNRNNHEYNTDIIIDANDSLLDRVNINIDTSNGINEQSNQFHYGIPSQSNVTSWNHAPVIAKIQMGSATFIGAKNIPRPQLHFKDIVDNSDSLWVPKISDKPNNIKPLALSILYNDDGEAVGYEHPYRTELDLYHPPSHLLQADSKEPKFPAPLEDTKLTYVDTAAKLNALVEHLMTVNEVAVDLEHHSYRTYQGITCLIQISTDGGGDFIIDALAVREYIHKLNLPFTNPKKIKVFHGAESDVIWLQRDFGVYIVGLFDTHQAAKALNLAGLSLKYLLMKYCRVDTDKKYQLADWRIRPLPEELVQYARMDTHYLLYIWRQMRAELLKQSSSLLLSVFNKSRQICGLTYNKEVITDSSHLPLYRRSKKSFNSRQMAALKMLYKWRDTQARLLDESTTYLLPNHMMLSLAETLPREMQGVNAVCNPMPPFIKQNLITIHRMLLSCRELPNEPQLFHMPTGIGSMINTYLLLCYNVHDFRPESSEEYGTSVDLADDIHEKHSQHYDKPPDAELTFIVPSQQLDTDETDSSNLNAEAEQFLPPFHRYRKYRYAAQLKEMKEFKAKEAKIAALGKGNELIKKEVLDKLQQAKSQIESEETKSVPTDATIEIENSDDFKKSQRKRKLSRNKAEQERLLEIPKEHKKKEIANLNSDSNVKQFNYKNADYKKFHKATNKDHKQKQQQSKL